VAGALSRGVDNAPWFARTAPATHLDTDLPDYKGTPMSNVSASSYDGTLERTTDGGVIRFERHLPYPIRDVWDAITNPSGWQIGGCRSTPTSRSTSARVARWCSPAGATNRWQ